MACIASPRPRPHLVSYPTYIPYHKLDSKFKRTSFQLYADHPPRLANKGRAYITLSRHPSTDTLNPTKTTTTSTKHDTPLPRPHNNRQPPPRPRVRPSLPRHHPSRPSPSPSPDSSPPHKPHPANPPPHHNSAYSAHEHATLSLPSSSLQASSPFSPSSSSPSSFSPTTPPGTTPTGTTPTDSLPLDIILETLVAVVLLCLGIVLSNSADASAGTGKGKGGEGGLRPVEWGVWGGGVERDGSGTGMGNPFRALEVRRGFLDVRVCFSLFHPFCFLLFSCGGWRVWCEGVGGGEG